MKFVVARLTGEDRWANDGRRAARTDDEKGDLTPGGAGGAAPERPTVGGVGGSTEEGAGGEGAGSDNSVAGLQARGGDSRVTADGDDGDGQGSRFWAVRHGPLGEALLARRRRRKFWAQIHFFTGFCAPGGLFGLRGADYNRALVVGLRQSTSSLPPLPQPLLSPLPVLLLLLLPPLPLRCY